MIPNRAHPGRGDDGFTIVELVLAITIEVIVVAALAMAFIGILKGTKNVNESLDRSSDARIAANYIISDARNASGPETSLSDTTSCPDPSPPVSGTPTPVASFAWLSTGSAGGTTTNVVNYVLVQNSLLRRQCKGPALVSDRAVASTVASVTAACSPIADCSGTPSSITVTVTEVADAQGAVYQYKLTGAFRKLNGTGPPVPSGPSQSVILLGTGGSCAPGVTGISVTGSASMKVYGNAYVNTTDGSTCKAMTVGNSGTFQAATLKFLQGGSCSSITNGLPCPPSTTYSPAVADPYAALTAPSTSGLPVQTGCSGPQATQTASPGFYSTGFTLGGGNTCTLASGIYIVQGGFNVGNGAVLKTGAGGVLIYLTTGQFAVGGGSAITLTAMTSGTYAGLVLWQAAADTNTITWSNGGALVFNGAIYGPKAQLNISGNAQTPIVSSLIVQSIILTNSGGITVGFPLSITAPVSLPAWTVGRAYPTTAADANGGGGVYTWSATGLPTGMTISPTSGTISGTPGASGSFTVTITLNDAAGDTADTSALPLTINAAPNINPAALPDGDAGVAYNRTITTSGGSGTGTLTWSATGLPSNLSMSSAGVITGTPSAAGPSTVDATVTDSTGATDTQSVSLTINGAPTIPASSLTAGEKTVVYTDSVSGSGGSTPYTWSATGLPTNLVMSSAGVITGTPNVSGPFTVAVTLTDAAGAQVSKNLSLTINPQPTITSVALTNGTGTSGTIDKGDTISIVFSSQMKVAGFCSGAGAWSGDGSDQSITGDNVVSVVVTNSGSGDSVGVTTGSGCTFNFGAINLSSKAYVTSTATFKGAGANKSTINWTASTHTLTITLGVLLSGAPANVPGNTSPVYTPNAANQDSQGAAIGNSPFTLSPAAKRF